MTGNAMKKIISALQNLADDVTGFAVGVALQLYAYQHVQRGHTEERPEAIEVLRRTASIFKEKRDLTSQERDALWGAISTILEQEDAKKGH